MSRPTQRQFTVMLITKGFFAGSVEASSHDEAVEKTFHVWRTECPHPFERCDDDELIDVIAEEVTP